MHYRVLSMSVLFRTPTTERILAALYLTPSRTFSLADLLEVVGDEASRRTVIYTIGELVREGFAVKDASGHGWPTYQANERSFAFPELCSLAAKMLGREKEIGDLVTVSADVIGAAIYGSTARGAARADSDIDLLLVVHDPASPSLLELTTALYEAGQRAGRTLNATVYARDEFQAKKTSAFLSRVLSSRLIVLREDEPLFGSTDARDSG